MANTPPTRTGTLATLADGTEDTAYTVTAANLLAGYTDAENDTLLVVNLTADHGTVVDNGAGGYTITPDENYNGVVALSYGVSDGTEATPATQSFTLAPVNDAPVVTAGQSFSVAENQTAVGTVVATDVDAGDTRTFALSGTGADDALFNISSTGVLSFKTAPDFENANHTPAYSVSVVATDAATLASSAQTVTVNVTNVNEAPVVTAGQSFSVAENQTAVGTVVATDVDAGDTRTFALSGTGADDALFNISSTGVLSFKTAPDFENANHTPAYSVSVVATDAATLASSAQTVTVNVTNVNEAPVVTAGQSFSVAENQTAVGTVVATDVDAGDTRTFALSGTGADDALFNISSTGVLSFKTAPDFENANHTPAYSVSVVATDAATLASSAQTVTVNVTNVNEAPVVTAGQSFSVAENQTAVGTVVATDVDAGDTRTFALSGTGADDALFNISSTGVLSFKTAPDFENANHTPAYSVSVVATDAATLASSAQTVTVNVTDTAPLLKAANAFATVAENTVGSIGNVNAVGGRHKQCHLHDFWGQ